MEYYTLERRPHPVPIEGVENAYRTVGNWTPCEGSTIYGEESATRVIAALREIWGDIYEYRAIHVVSIREVVDL